MATSFASAGQMLHAFRLKKGMSADDVAKRLGVSRAAVYRIEAGEIIKVDTLDRLATLLKTSVGSLLGLDVEYLTNATDYFERIFELEQSSDQVVAHFPPLSYLLTSTDYPAYLKQVLVESIPLHVEDRASYEAEIDAIICVLEGRKASRLNRRLSVINFVNMPELERWLRLGFLGRMDISPDEIARRRTAARCEVEHLIGEIEREAMGVQIGLIEDTLPNAAFQLFRTQDGTVLGLSPYRLSGELPNIRIGVAVITRDPAPVQAYEKLVDRLWARAYKGRDAVAQLQAILDRSAIRVSAGRKRKTA